jgi:hypothetical protein
MNTRIAGQPALEEADTRLENVSHLDLRRVRMAWIGMAIFLVLFWSLVITAIVLWRAR